MQKKLADPPTSLGLFFSHTHSNICLRVKYGYLTNENGRTIVLKNDYGKSRGMWMIRAINSESWISS